MRATEELSGKCKCNKCAYYRTVYNKEPCEDCTYEPDGEGGAIGTRFFKAGPTEMEILEMRVQELEFVNQRIIELINKYGVLF
jgi:hypothetical protein